MTNMLQFLRRKIKPFKKCTGNPSYSFEINNQNGQRRELTTGQNQNMTTNMTNIDYSENSSHNFTSFKLEKSKKSKFGFKFRRGSNKSNSNETTYNDSLNNRETTSSFQLQITRDEILKEEVNSDQIMTDYENELESDVYVETPVISEFDDSLQYVSDNIIYNEHEEIGWVHSYTNDDCINDLIDNTNYTRECLNGNNNHSMLTYNTKYNTTQNSNILDEDGLKQSTPFDEINSLYQYNNQRKNKRHSKVLSECGQLEKVMCKKSKTFQSQNEIQAMTQNEIEIINSPIFKKMDLKQNRKCRRSNTTFTMAGAKKNKIIDYFNNLEMAKPMRKNMKMFSSNKEIPQRVFHDIRNSPSSSEEENKSTSFNDSDISKTKSTDLSNSSSKNEVEKIQDLFFYDESLLSNRNTSNMTGDKLVLSTFLDSPVSVISEKSSQSSQSTESSALDSEDQMIITPVLRKNEGSKFVQLQHEIVSTNNSVEKFRRSSSMPGLNEPNLSIQANNSKITALKDDLNMNITPKKALSFEQNDMNTNSIENLSTPISHFVSSFEVSDEVEPKPFIRGQSRNLSKNIKQMFRNVKKLQLDALGNLESFYEAQISKVEADRKQNLELNPMNKKEINEFFDRQLQLLEERVQNNLEGITKEKSRKMSSSSSSNLKFSENNVSDDETDDKITQKRQISQKLAQIITSNNQNCNNNMGNITGFNRRSQSKNLMELKNNLITQKNLLPSKNLAANQSSDYSPKNGNNTSMFKRNLSLPFKQCKQNSRRISSRNESIQDISQDFSSENSPQSENMSQVINHKLAASPVHNQYQYQRNKVSVRHIVDSENKKALKKAHERCLSNNMAKIVKLNKSENESNNFVVSINSAFQPITKKKHSLSQNQLQQFSNNEFEAYEEVNCLGNSLQNESQNIFKPIALDVRRNSSIFYTSEEDSNEMVNQRRKMPVPRLSDSYLLFKIKQEKRVNDMKKSGCYQKQFQSNMSRNLSKANFHIETEV